MKSFLILLLITQNAWSWEIKKVGEEMQLSDPSIRTPEKVITAFESKTLPTERISSVTIVRYPENVGGTKSLSRSWSCAAFIQGKLLFKDEICLIEGKESRKAEFKVENKKLIYKFEELEESYPLQ